MAISVVTVAELEVGIHLPSDGRRAERRTAVESIVNSVWVLPYPSQAWMGALFCDQRTSASSCDPTAMSRSSRP